MKTTRSAPKSGGFDQPIEIFATEFLFTFSGDIFDLPPGFVLVNNGTVEHEIHFYRSAPQSVDPNTLFVHLGGDPTAAADALAAAGLEELGYVSAAPGEEAEFDLASPLPPAQYYFVCLVPIEDGEGAGTVHAEQGMWAQTTLVQP
jgi:hypothetical protein